jgi:hypothetical protein|tara:strand:- start:10206 stop:10601 length:396 start_codon:yes stop_codon:yes gene_type:complete
MAEEEVFWYHPDPSTVENWEFEFFNIQSGEWTLVEDLSAIYPCDRCFQAIVEIPEFHCCIRSRAVNEAGPSEWSDPITLPEPGMSSLFVVVALTVAMRQFLRQAKVMMRSFLSRNKKSPKDGVSSGDIFGR